MSKVLITGVAGFIGMHTAIKYLSSGYEVLGLDNFNEYYSSKLKRDRVIEIRKKAKTLNSSFTLYESDLNTFPWDSLSDVEIVIHLAAQAGVRYSITNPRAYIDSNILGFQCVLEFVDKNQISQFLYASSSSVYGKESDIPFHENENCSFPESYYAATKKANELMAYSYWKTKDMPSVGLRFFTVYGPWGRPDMAPFIFTKAAFESKPVKVFNMGNQTRDFTYIDDIVDGIFLMSLSKIDKAQVLNIGNGSPVKLMDFITYIELATGRPLKKIFTESQKGDVVNTYADITKLKSLSDFSPKTSIEHGLSKFIRWYEDYYY